MLELQKNFLAKFLNQISCNKGLKAKISCFFLFFFLFNPLGAWKFKLQKDCFVLDVTQAEEIQKSESTELHKRSKNVVNVENCSFLKINCGYLFVIWVEWKQSVCSVTLLYSSTFYSLFFFFLLLLLFLFTLFIVDKLHSIIT